MLEARVGRLSGGALSLWIPAVYIAMRIPLTSWALLSAAALSLAAPSGKQTIKVKESIVAPRGWTKREEAPRHLTIDLRIALPQSNFPLLEQHLYEVR